MLRGAKITAENFSKHAVCEGRRPQTIAGVSLYMILHFHKKYKDEIQLQLERISELVNIGSTTILETYRLVSRHKDKLLPEYLLNRNSSARMLQTSAPTSLPGGGPAGMNMGGR